MYPIQSVDKWHAIRQSVCNSISPVHPTEGLMPFNNNCHSLDIVGLICCTQPMKLVCTMVDYRRFYLKDSMVWIHFCLNNNTKPHLSCTYVLLSMRNTNQSYVRFWNFLRFLKGVLGSLPLPHLLDNVEYE